MTQIIKKEKESCHFSVRTFQLRLDSGEFERRHSLSSLLIFHGKKLKPREGKCRCKLAAVGRPRRAPLALRPNCQPSPVLPRSGEGEVEVRCPRPLETGSSGCARRSSSPVDGVGGRQAGRQCSLDTALDTFFFFSFTIYISVVIFFLPRGRTL